MGEVVECGQHPNADKLRVTKINVGGDELLDIVCGAPNCRLGIKVAVAVWVPYYLATLKLRKRNYVASRRSACCVASLS